VFPLADGLPQHAWLWLKQDTTWLDYRPLDPHSGYTGELARAGVDIDIPIEPQANVEALLAAGEGLRVEFKEQLVRGRQLKTIAAFANGDDGTLVFGINRDETTVTGLDGDPRQLRDQIGQRIRAAITPTPEFTISDHVVQGKTILLVEVTAGSTPPYGVIANSDTRDRPEYYVRRGASTYPAQPSDIRQAVLPSA
jgi:predicted HTH transcriptional regulator